MAPHRSYAILVQHPGTACSIFSAGLSTSPPSSFSCTQGSSRQVPYGHAFAHVTAMSRPCFCTSTVPCQTLWSSRALNACIYQNKLVLSRHQCPAHPAAFCISTGQCTLICNIATKQNALFAQVQSSHLLRTFCRLASAAYRAEAQGLHIESELPWIVLQHLIRIDKEN